ncbi:G-type lectin S-receptor-like serine/threonine-protein kinase, partial [Glycine soja]
MKKKIINREKLQEQAIGAEGVTSDTISDIKDSIKTEKEKLVTSPYQYLTSWRDFDDPSEGEFLYRVNTHSFPQLVAPKGTKVLYNVGTWNGYLFSGVSWQRMHAIFNFSLDLIDKEFNPTGTTEHFLWSSQTQSWDIVNTHPIDQCEYYAVCGVNSNCNINDLPICVCLQGFIPKYQAKWDSHDWSGGYRFLKYSGMKLRDISSSWFNKSLSLKECETLCLRNCLYTAYANLYVIGGGSGYLHWFDDIVDMRNHTDEGQEIYIRLPFFEL